MSYYFKSVPQNIALILKDKYYLDIFIETGTYAGATAEWAARHFLEVHTIEMQQDYFRMAELKLAALPNVFMYMNDSRNVLHEILASPANEIKSGMLFYLDAHWSEGANYGRPLIDSSAMDEILIINEFCENTHAIIVDDAHRFGTEHWPTKHGIVQALENNGKRVVRELLDVLIATPVLLNGNYKLRRSYIDAYLNASATNGISLGRIRN